MAASDAVRSQMARRYESWPSRLNVGFARGNNAGIRETESELVLLLNSDTIVPDGAIDASSLRCASFLAPPSSARGSSTPTASRSCRSAG